MGSIPGSRGRAPRGGNGNPLQYSCLEQSMDRGSWWATVHGVTKSQTRLKRLSTSNQQPVNIFLLKIWLIHSVQHQFHQTLSCGLPLSWKRHTFSRPRTGPLELSQSMQTRSSLHLLFSRRSAAIILMTYSFKETYLTRTKASLVAQTVKNPPAI